MKYKLVNEEIKSNYGEEILRSRGINDVNLFLNPTEACLQNWQDLCNIEDGLRMIDDTIKEEKPYAIIADCDVDGATSFAIIYQYLKRLNPSKEIEYFIHEGKQHGLEDLCDKLLEKDYSAIIIPDAGSNDSQYVEKFNCPVLVLDHHLLEDEYIAQNMILINNQTSEFYKNKNLSGAGVVWQFCRAMDSYFEKDWANDYIDLAALGIDADMMSMLEYENQYIIQNGFANIKNFFFKVLIDKQSYSMGDKINPISVAFYIVPMINAMIRVGTMEEKERLYRAFIAGEEKISSNKRGAKGTLDYLAVESARECTNAKSRQDKTKERIVEQLEAKIFKHDLLENEILFVRLDEDDVFPAPLNGLVATQLSAKYHKPTVVARLNEEGYIRGSARGINQSELASFKDYLNSTGLFEYTAGHDNAFGLSIPNIKLEVLHKKANKDLQKIDFGESAYEVNFERRASASDISNIIFDLNRYETVWGQNNPECLLAITNLFVNKEEIQIIGRNKDTLKIEKNGITYIKFHAKDIISELKELNSSLQLTIIGRASVNSWMGHESPQIIISDIEFQDAELAFKEKNE